MTTNDQRQRLKQFFASSFHEDWDLHADSSDDVITSFIGGGRPRSELAELSAAIADFANEHPADEDLDQALFKELGCYYLPAADGIATREWLAGIAATLRRAATSPG